MKSIYDSIYPKVKDSATIIEEETNFINDVQKEIISFCRDKFYLNNKGSFYNLNFDSQIEFNECVTSVIDIIKTDIFLVDDYYEKCINSEELKRSNINYCNRKKREILDDYKKYLIDKKGIYIEFSNEKFDLNDKH